MSQQPLTFYDIAMRPPIEQTCGSPNPWKARLALNFKNTPYTTTWVDLPDIAPLRRKLNVPAGRKFADGSDYYTLPVLYDPARECHIGDSFDIAVYLHETYPGSGDRGELFPVLNEDQKLDFDYSATLLIPLSEVTERGKEEAYAEYARFNIHVDAAFTSHVGLAVQGLKFPIETAAQSQAMFCQRAGVDSWDKFEVSGEARTKMIESFKKMLGDLGRLFMRDARGPFILGGKPCYADFIVGGWLRMMSVCLPGEEWEELRGWHGGLYGRVFEALKEFQEVK
ncbi:hypothetical protein BDV18DRAFT_160440 [Aspergillus unguis]